MSEELIKWLEAKADYHDMDAELWTAGSEEAENERLEAIKYRQCARQLAEAQKVEPFAYYKIVPNKEVEPFVYLRNPPDGTTVVFSQNKDDFTGPMLPLYTSPPTQEGMVSVPEKMTLVRASKILSDLRSCEPTSREILSFAYGWDLCREAMRKSAQGEG